MYNYWSIFTQCTISHLYDNYNGALPGHLWPGVKRSYISLLKKFGFTGQNHLFGPQLLYTILYVVQTYLNLDPDDCQPYPKVGIHEMAYSSSEGPSANCGKNLYIGDSCVLKRVRRFWYVSSYQKMFVMYDYFQHCNLWLNSNVWPHRLTLTFWWRSLEGPRKWDPTKPQRFLRHAQCRSVSTTWRKCIIAGMYSYGKLGYTFCSTLQRQTCCAAT